MVRLRSLRRFLHRPGWPLAGWLGGLSVVVLASVVRVAQVRGLADQGWFAKYTFFADEILSGRLPVHRLGDLSPGYLWFLVLLRGPLGLDFYQLRVLQIGLVSVVAVLCGLTAWRLGGRLAGAVALLAVLANRAALVNATEAEPETLILLLNCAALCLGLAFKSRWSGLLSGLLFGLSAVTRPSVLVAAAAILAGGWWNRASGRKPRWRAWPLLFAIGLGTPLVGFKLAYRAIPGAQTLMNPGTVFYEGANPASTGYQGDAPRIVKDLEAADGEPDSLHVAYRTVATRALGDAASEVATNRFWSNRAIAFLGTYPGPSLRLMARKLGLIASSYEAYDLVSMVGKEEQLRQQIFWLPFGFLLSFALVAAIAAFSPVFALREGAWAESLLLLLYTFAYIGVMVLFYVTARQRNPLLPALAILAGLAAGYLFRAWAAGWRRLVVVVTVLGFAVGVFLGRDGRAQLEDRHSWQTLFMINRTLAECRSAREQNDETLFRRWQLESTLWRLDGTSQLPATVVRAALARELARENSTQRRFDLALLAMGVDDWAVADRVLAQLQEVGYRPLRGNAVTSSLAFHRVRCQLGRGRWAGAADLLRQADREAPGQVAVLALTAAVAEATALTAVAAAAHRRLAALHDPFSADFALARAYSDTGNQQKSTQLLADLAQRIPEWTRPHQVRH